MTTLLTKIGQRLLPVADKAVATAAETAIVAVGVDSAHANAFTMDWRVIGGAALAGAFLSVLYNLSREGLTGRLNRDPIDLTDVD